MKMTQRAARQLKITEIALTALIVLLLAVVAWFAWSPPAHHKVHSYEACIKKPGSYELLTYPGICVTKDGQRFVQPQ